MSFHLKLAPSKMYRFGIVFIWPLLGCFFFSLSLYLIYCHRNDRNSKICTPWIPNSRQFESWLPPESKPKHKCQLTQFMWITVRGQCWFVINNGAFFTIKFIVSGFWSSVGLSRLKGRAYISLTVKLAMGIFDIHSDLRFRANQRGLMLRPLWCGQPYAWISSRL